MPRNGRTRGQPNGRDHRQPEREKRRKRGASIDPPGFDAGKKIKGKKRHVLVDTAGLAAARHCSCGRHPGSRRRRAADGTLFGLFPFLLKLYADSGYQGPKFQPGLASRLRQINVEIVKRSDVGKVRRAAQALDRRTHHRLAQPMSPAGQGLGVPQPQRACLPALGVHPADGPKALSNPVNDLGRNSSDKASTYRRAA